MLHLCLQKQGSTWIVILCKWYAIAKPSMSLLEFLFCFQLLHLSGSLNKLTPLQGNWLFFCCCCHGVGCYVGKHSTSRRVRSGFHKGQSLRPSPPSVPPHWHHKTRLREHGSWAMHFAALMSGEVTRLSWACASDRNQRGVAIKDPLTRCQASGGKVIATPNSSPLTEKREKNRVFRLFGFDGYHTNRRLKYVNVLSEVDHSSWHLKCARQKHEIYHPSIKMRSRAMWKKWEAERQCDAAELVIVQVSVKRGHHSKSPQELRCSG